MKISASARASGVALVLVLSFLALITIIVTAFFFSVTSQVALTDAAASSAATDQLADSAVNLVMAQIVDATKGVDTTGGSSASAFISWASQPGMIRTWTSSPTPSTGPKLAKYNYKLYSSDSMVVAGGPGFTPDDLTSWSSLANRDTYTDLNSPVSVPGTGTGTGTALVYPIVDPSADGKSGGTTIPGVDGFSITAPPDFKSNTAEGPGNNRAPMPVKWLYQLKDGTLVPPTNGSAKTVTVASATAANPIVGRIAFWTDDETCKININTASEGTYWDMPRIYSNEDFGSLSSANNVSTTGFSVCPPANKEFQRYPGHPATTCLSPVLGPLANMLMTYPLPASPAPGSTITTQLPPYYNLAPRVGLPTMSGGGGSEAGTKLYPNLATGLTVDTDRLYATVDDLIFSALALNGKGQRTPNATSSNGTLKKDAVAKARFFLTANSNAPEITLYNTPRVSIWPVWTAAKKLRTPYDSLSAFAATIIPGGATLLPADVDDKAAYYFTRSDPRSQSVDFTKRNQTLYTYLKNMTGTAIPGFGGTFQSKYPAPSGQIQLRAVDPSMVKVTDCDQLLTEIYDYIRCTNLQDKTTSTSNYTKIYNWASTNNVPPGAAEVIPILNPLNGTQGFGRTYTVAQAVLHFYATAEAPETYKNSSGSNVTTNHATTMKAIFYIVPATPGQGLAPYRGNLKFKVTGLDQLQIVFAGTTNPVGLQFPATGTNTMDLSDIDVLHGRAIGGAEMPNSLLLNSGTGNKPMNTSLGTAPAGSYPFVSVADIPVPSNATADALTRFRFFDFLGTPQPLTIEIYNADTTGPGAGALIQTISLNLPRASTNTPPISAPAGKFRVPRRLTGAGVFGARNITNPSSNLVPGSYGYNGYNPPYKERTLTVDPEGTSNAAGDTVVAVEVAGVPTSVTGDSPAARDLAPDGTAGDFRMISGLHQVPTARYRANDNWLNPYPEGTAYAHGLSLTIGDYLHGGHFGNLVYFGAASTDDTVAPTRYYYQNGYGRQPVVPSRARDGVKQVNGTLGDWDTGVGDQRDGAHINKPDEGDTSFADGEGSGFRPPYSLGYHKGFASATNGFFSPTRMVPSPMMFGSLPTGVLRMMPWQTLSFAPRPDSPSHPGNAAPRDHLLADLFWMPVVEPWAISQPFSTTGKINMNYEIQPFTYIQRQTGLWAVLKSTKFAAVPPGLNNGYKPFDPASNGAGKVQNIRQSLDLKLTADAVGKRFGTTGQNDLYRSATEICEVNLIPPGQSDAGMAGWWKNYTLTGDNLREKPYVDLYPRLTTKSNTYTVHVHVQSLKKSRNTPANQWVFGADTVAGDYRGSTILERYVDSSDPKLPDFAANFQAGAAAKSANLDDYYRMRVVATRRFSP